MTLLATIAGRGYILSCSDTRITVQRGNTFQPLDEHFNKHIIFHSAGVTGIVSYTGLAQWVESGRVTKLYDKLSESLKRSAKESLAFGPLTLDLAMDVIAPAARPHFTRATPIEIHLTARHPEIPYPLIYVASTFRSNPPWTSEGAFRWEYHFEGLHFYIAALEDPEVVFGGMDTVIRAEEKTRLLKAITRGASAFEVSNMVARLIEKAATRSAAIGQRSVAVLLPDEGFLDTNLWDARSDGKLVAYLPRIVFPDREHWGPSEFQVSLNAIIQGHLPKQSLFFKSILYQQWKKSIRRRMFRLRKGKKIPGIMGLLTAALYLHVPEGYYGFGLTEDKNDAESTDDARNSDD